MRVTWSIWLIIVLKHIYKSMYQMHICKDRKGESKHQVTRTLNMTKIVFKKKPKLSRHIKLNDTNIALLLQEATQKYRKLTDYKTKDCYLSLLFSVLIATCAYFAFLNGRVFSVLGHSLERHKRSFVLYIVSFFALKIFFSKVSLAKYHCLHKNPSIFHVFSYHRTSLQISFINSSVLIFLKLY